MEKLWFPQRNKIDSPVAILKTFIFTIQHRISRSTIERDTNAHKEFPLLSFGGLSELLEKWGLRTVSYTLDLEKLKNIPFPSISFIHDNRNGIKMGLFVMLQSYKDGIVEYLHPGKGWVREEANVFATKWANAILSLVECTMPDGEQDFEENEQNYISQKNANPELKILRVGDSFLTEEECEYVIELSKPRFKRSRVMSDNDEDHHGRTSYSAELVLPEDEILNRIKKRGAKLIGMPESHFEFFQCVSYGPGEEFQNHFDTFDETTEAGRIAVEEEGQRKYTMLVYLNENFEGGNTYFPHLDILMEPKKGRVIIFDNLDETDKVRKAAYHAGLPVTSGKKYAINMWVRTKPTIPSKYILHAQNLKGAV